MPKNVRNYHQRKVQKGMVRWPQCDHHSVCFDGNLSQGPAIVFGFTAPLMWSSEEDRWTIAEVGVHYQYDSWHIWILTDFTPDDYSHLHQRLHMSMTAFISFLFHVKPAMGSHSKHHFGLWAFGSSQPLPTSRPFNGLWPFIILCIMSLIMDSTYVAKAGKTQHFPGRQNV